jgi:hypothetical protein
MANKIPEFNPDDYPDKVCCGILEHLVNTGYKFPFSIPIQLSQDMSLKAGSWAVTVYEQDTRTLGLNQRKHVTVFLSYCPFCGKKIGGK